MDLSTSHYLQLIVAIILGIVLLQVSYVVSERKVLGFLILLIPFQPLTSKYGSINDVLVYMVFSVYLLQGKFKELPLLGGVMVIFFAYALSFTQAPRAAYMDNMIYMTAIGANFILFYLVYNFLMRDQDWSFIWKILIVTNVFVVAYSLLQAVSGAETMQLFGIGDLSFNNSRIHVRGSTGYATARLTGPFKATALTSEAIVILMLITGYTIIHTSSSLKRRWLTALFGMDSAFLIATGNRGGIITLAIGGILFLYAFRRELGVPNVLKIFAGATLLFVAASVVMIQYTQWNVLYDRLEKTEFHGVVPDSRVGWFDIWDRLIEKPVIGHGPRMKLENEGERRISGFVRMGYPHSLYLYLLYTIGFFGLMAYLLYFARIGWFFFRSRLLTSDDKFLNGIPKLGLIILVVVAVSEYRIELFRYITHDYQQFIFTVFGIFFGLTEMLRRRIMKE